MPDELEVTLWIRQLQDPSTPSPQKDLAWRGLYDLISRLAKSLAKKFGQLKSQLGCDLVDEAAAWVWKRLPAYDPGKGKFSSWAYKTLSRQLIDLVRKQSRERKNQPGEGQERLANAEDEFTMDLRVDLGTPFSKKDVQRISSWKNLKAMLALLSLSGLWRKVPASNWEFLVCQADIAVPFPPAEFLASQDTEERHLLLAEHLEIQPKTIDQWRNRHLGLLENLDFVRGHRND